MKKAFLLLTALFISGTAHATILSLPSYQSGNDVTIANLDSTNTSIENWANGGVEGGGVNILAGSIQSVDLNSTVSPITRWADSFNDYTVSGMLPVTSADLSSDISAGVSYVSGYRVSTAATNHTYTASKDTYVYINQGGYFVYSEVANGAAAPTTPSNSLLLAKVVTNGTAISSVSDLRTTSIQITTTTTNFPADYRAGAYISWDSTTAVHHEAGSVAIGSTIYSNAADTSSKTLSTGSNWIEGATPSLTAATKVYTYAYNNSGSAWDFKYSTADPVYSDTDGNSAGVLRYYTTGGVDYRAIGWLVPSADVVQTYNVGNVADTNVKNRTYRNCGSYAALGTVNMVADNTRPLSNEGNGIPCLDISFVPTSSLSTITVKANIAASTSSTASQLIYAVYKNNDTESFGVASALSNTSPQNTPIWANIGSGDLNLKRIWFRAGSLGGRTTYLNGDASAGALFGNAIFSSVEVEEQL